MIIRKFVRIRAPIAREIDGLRNQFIPVELTEIQCKKFDGIDEIVGIPS